MRTEAAGAICGNGSCMESQINLSIAGIVVFFSLLFSYLFFQWRLEREFLAGEEKVKVGRLIPLYILLPAVILLFAVPRIFEGASGFTVGFNYIFKFSLALIIFLFGFSYRFTKISRLNLPAEFVEKWRKLELAFIIAMTSFIVSVVVWGFIRWQTEGYKIFQSE